MNIMLIYLLIYSFLITLMLKKYMDRNIDLTQKNKDLMKKLLLAADRNDKYRSEIIKYKKIEKNNQIVDKELKEAFRKLMIYSHPDKGFCKNSDDFIKYKKIYDSFK